MVLNAGQQISCQSIVELPLEQIKDTFMVNIIAMFALVKEAVPHIPAGGAIVTTTSVQAFNPRIMQQQKLQSLTLRLA